MVEYVPAKSIVNRVQNGWFGVDYNMNIYRGCSHGCIYCDSRSDCYRIDRFDQVRVKEDALRIIRDDLRRKVKKGVVATGSMSDPYNPLERDLQLTRHALELLSAYEFGAAIATKSDLILRDVDVLQEIRKISPVLCKMTVTTCDDELCRRVEPHVSVSSARFAALEKLSAGGIFTGILMMPVLPFLEDTPENVLGIIDRAAHAGVRFIYPAFGMTMRQNQREWYLSKLQELFPEDGLRERYERRYPYQYQCVSDRAKPLWKLFTARCDEKGILYKMPDIIRAYRLGYEDNQLKFY
ncbi:SPL family radical SAM protein [Candidatus Soleaferrea massiliensis]|uniref:SPL family radical SAM protein n=1 Tax=Candidatus Soleaferrea massiliensis TaxID=1470354 RepID=UPI000591554C|nr:radical SAM protein [Candidatus Soleaferrea massiliensis]